MSPEPDMTPQELYEQGMARFREGEWAEALRLFTDLRARSDSYAEVDSLIADARLKMEIERVSMPDGTPPPRRRRWPLVAAAALAVALLGGGAALGAGWLADPSPAPTARPTLALSLPTVAPTATPSPTATPLPTATPSPTATPQPTATPPPTATPEAGTLTVRTADGQPLTRTTGNIAIILDASGSMLAQLDGRRRIDIAREALGVFIEKLPDDTTIALRAYGHRRASDCADSELLAPPARLDREALVEQINAVEPVQNGRTPIGLSLQQIPEDLRGIQGDTLVVLVSDGEESCDADPVAIADELHAANPRLRIAVIGFSIEGDESRARLRAIADSGGGAYFDAGSTAQLAEALRQAVALTYRVRDSAGTEVYSGPLGSVATLPAGEYTVVIGGDASLTLEAIQVGGSQPTVVEVQEQGGALQAAVAAPGAQP